MNILDYANNEMINNAVLGVRQKFPLLDSVLDNLKVSVSSNISTCLTDGKNVVCNPEFLASLTYDERVFAIAHEVFHVAFDHILRSKDKDIEDWNIASDAVINQILKDNGLPLIDGGIDIIEAKGKSTEEMYELLHDSNKQSNNQSSNGESGDNNSQNSKADNSLNEKSQSNGSQESTNENQSQSDKSKQNDKESGRGQSNDTRQDQSNSDNGQSSESQQSKTNTDKSQNSPKQNSSQDRSSQGENNGLDNKKVDKVNSGKNGGESGEQSNKHDLQNSSNDTQENSQNSKPQPQITNHNRWAEAVKQFEKDKELASNRQSKVKKEQEANGDSPKDIKSSVSDFEKEFEKKNNEKKEEKGRELIKQFKEHMGSKTSGKGTQGESGYTFGQVGKSEKVFSWKTILKRYLDDEISMYSYRRADEDNFFQARVEDIEQFDMPGIEVMLDTSYSVPDDLLKEFLRQLKSLIKDTKLKVACFSDYAYEFEKIKKPSDIDNFVIKGRSGTDFNNAARSFTWKGKDAKNLNRIIFTDGQADFSLTDKKYKQLIWVVYDNPSFRTDFGRVIHVNSKQILEGKSQDLEIL